MGTNLVQDSFKFIYSWTSISTRINLISTPPHCCNTQCARVHEDIASEAIFQADKRSKRNVFTLCQCSDSAVNHVSIFIVEICWTSQPGCS